MVFKFNIILLIVYLSYLNSLKLKTFSPRSIIVPFTIVSILSNDLNAFASETGEKLFVNNCSSCHAGGSNLINRKKTLDKTALIENNYYDISDIKNLISNGKGFFLII